MNREPGIPPVPGAGAAGDRARLFARLPRLPRDDVAWRAAQELEDWSYVNLGLGIPTVIADYVRNRPVTIHTENGMLKVGPWAQPGQEDWDLYNAGAEPVSELPGSSYFDTVESFAMMRGGHIDVAVMGALQVSERGDLANWNNPERGLPGTLGSIGGCMDLAAGAKRIIITMEHVTRNGQLKILKECTFPLTGRHCVDLIVTDLAVIKVTPQGLLLKEVAPGVTPQAIQALTEPTLLIDKDLREMPRPRI